jgi:DNA-binding CsgD family transcriptional regulator
MPTEIVGRDGELRALRAFVASIAEGPAILVLEGEPGVGKTTLWRAGVAAAGQAGIRVAQSSPVEAETKLAFAALGDLLEGLAVEVVGDLPVPQQRALGAALLWEEIEGRSPDQRTVAVALLNVLRRLAGAGPVLLAVDDVQWLDSSSAAALAFAARRLRSEPIGLLFTRRVTGERLTLGLDRSVGDDRQHQIEVGPISPGALHCLLHDRLGLVFPSPVLRRLHQATGGNPLFALEVARVLERRGRPLAVGEPLPVPESLHELIQDRLAGLPGSTRTALAAAAALSQPTITLVEAATGVGGALGAAADAQLVELDGNRVRFTHPLLASAAYASADPNQRRELHRRLAALVGDPEERARHLAAATIDPDEGIARALEVAAERTRRRGAPAAAAELAEHAYRLTLADRPDNRVRRLLETAHYHFEAGDAARAQRLFEEAVALAPPGSRRAEALTLLAETHGFAGDLRAESDLYRAVIAETQADPAVRSMAEQGLTLNLLLQLRPATSRPAQAWPNDDADVASLAEWLAWQAVIETLLARPGALDRARRAVELTRREAGPGRPGFFLPAVTPDFVYGALLSWSDDLYGARERFKQARTRALGLGDEAALPQILRAWSYTEWLGGNWPHAERLASEGYEAALQSGQRVQLVTMLGTKALLAASFGRIEDTRRDAEAGLALADETGYMLGGLLCLTALGLLELSLDNPAGTHQRLERLVGQAEAAGLREPTVARFLVDEIEALVALDRLDQAEVLLQRFETTARALDRASALAVAERCGGLIAAARNDLAGSTAALERALREHERAAQPFELARTLLTLGHVRRRARQKRPARDALQAALVTFEELGAALWADKARGELARIGGRPTATGALTPSEVRVAQLVAEGRSNKEVASVLFISRQTVEGHLKRIYLKLGVRSRAELAYRFALPQGEHASARSPKSPDFRDSRDRSSP